MKEIDHQLNGQIQLCPVCGMDASAINLPKTMHKGRIYFFCTFHCLKLFEQEPNTYLSMQMKRIQARSREIHLVHKEMLDCLTRAAEFKDNETAKHTKRIGAYSYKLAMLLDLDRQYAERIRETAPLHDIGKIGVPESILLKPGKLNKDERRVIERHPEMGAKILGDNLHSKTMKMALIIALTHHERWDGTGYPFGIVGEKIPIEGRIVGICDVFDALISVRPYKSAWSTEKIRLLISSEQGKHFEPRLAQLFLRHFSDFIDIYNIMQDDKGARI